MRPYGRKPPADGETPEKPKEQSSSFSGVSVRWGTGGPTLFFSNRKFGSGFCPTAGNRSQAFSLPEKTGAVRGPALGTSRGRARLSAGTNRARVLPGAAAAGRETPEKPRSKAQLFGRFCAWGNVWPHVLRIHGSLARAFVRRVSSRPQGTGGGLSPCPGKQEPGVGPTLGKNRGRARLGKETNPERGLPGAAALEKAKGAKLSFSGVSVRGGTGGPTLFFSNRKFGAGFCPAAGNRNQAFSPPGKTEAQRGLAPRKNRVRARLKCRHKHGARLARRSRAPGKNRVRARFKCRHKQGARIARRSRGLFPCPGKQEPCVGAHPEPAACVRG